ncbi:MAG: hypothetical protein ACRCXX_11760 [Cetobacterium sp.]|uniref:hypothetical protein n=1 Tax=Cetobacterium sp. TaxID=2071632 RepID=UPI003F384017
MISLFKNVMDIERVSVKPDDNGEAVKGWHLLSENVACSLSKKSITNLKEEPKSTSLFKYILFAPLEIDIKRGDRVTIDKDIKFICQEPFKYKLLKKQEVEVEVWQG